MRAQKSSSYSTPGGLRGIGQLLAELDQLGADDGVDHEHVLEDLWLETD